MHFANPQPLFERELTRKNQELRTNFQNPPPQGVFLFFGSLFGESDADNSSISFPYNKERSEMRLI
jgi:hypothetical protein